MIRVRNDFLDVFHTPYLNLFLSFSSFPSFKLISCVIILTHVKKYKVKHQTVASVGSG